MARRNDTPAAIHVDAVENVTAKWHSSDWELTYTVNPARSRTVVVTTQDLAGLFANDHLYIDSPVEAAS